MRPPSIFFALVLFLYGLLSTPTIYANEVLEVDVYANVYRVVDGDTLDTFPAGRVRLADVNAPEIDTLEGVVARDALTELIGRHGPHVYLDIDDKHVMDRYNRIVAVVYLRYNSTHLLNVNKWLLESGHAVINDYDNEFDPDKWSLYLYCSSDSCKVVEHIISTVTATSIIISTTKITISTTFTQTVFSTATVTIKQEVGVSRDGSIILVAVILMLIIMMLLIMSRLTRRR